MWQNCGSYDAAIASENAVHSLEHGAVWVTYRPNLSQDEIERMGQLASGQSFVLVTPFPDLPAPIVASAWGKHLSLDSAEDARLGAVHQGFPGGTADPGAGRTVHRGNRAAIGMTARTVTRSNMGEHDAQRIRAWDEPPVLVALAVVVVSVAYTVFLAGRPPSDDSPEAGFARDMARHHAQGVEMAQIVRDRTDDPEIRILATDIALTQQAQIGPLHGWLETWGLVPTGDEPAMAWMGTRPLG